LALVPFLRSHPHLCCIKISLFPLSRLMVSPRPFLLLSPPLFLRCFQSVHIVSHPTPLIPGLRPPPVSISPDVFFWVHVLPFLRSLPSNIYYTGFGSFFLLPPCCCFRCPPSSQRSFCSPDARLTHRPSHSQTVEGYSFPMHTSLE